MCLDLQTHPTQPHNMLRSDLQTPSSQKTALHIGAEHGRTSTVRLLLSLDPDVGAKNSEGQTALHLAVQNQQQDVIEELVKTLIDLGVSDKVTPGTSSKYLSRKSLRLLGSA